MIMLANRTYLYYCFSKCLFKFLYHNAQKDLNVVCCIVVVIRLCYIKRQYCRCEYRMSVLINVKSFTFILSMHGHINFNNFLYFITCVMFLIWYCFLNVILILSFKYISGFVFLSMNLQVVIYIQISVGN